MSIYTIKRCLDRAEANRGDGDYPRIIREHEEVARFDPDPETRRIARGFALISTRRLEEERWRAEAYARLARGEDIDAAMEGNRDPISRAPIPHVFVESPARRPTSKRKEHG